MEKIIKWLSVVFIAFFVGSFATYLNTRKTYMTEIERLQKNEETLLTDVENYRVCDSLNAAKVGVLNLEIEQYKKTHEEDLRIIHEMGVKTKNLQSAYSAQLSMKREISGVVKDSIVYVDKIIHDSLKCVRVRDEWLDLDLCFRHNGKYYGTLQTRDSLLIISEVKYKRFLGFLWKTRKVKSRKVHVVSKNPYTKIMGFEYIELKN